MTIREKAAMMKLDSSKMASTDIAVRNAALEKITESLLAGKERIFEANAKDMERAQADNILPAVIKRLKFSEAKLSDAIAGIHNLIALPDPLFQIQLKRQLDEGLTLIRETCPIGVIGVIFEARPDAMVQIASLCIKSGNCAILKGGSETRETNKLLFELIYEAALSSGLPQGCLF
ncbi:MAG: gamma-glutamyl-phosphate reductase, partial [Roseburia sp.]|nr:gamma-glutamyl-phosphate reductase [Roseburia sp.]